MALKDLVSDLSNFKGRSQYDNLDTQIEKGVDFFPNDNASGFTPKTDLESLYKNNSELGAINKPNVSYNNINQKPSDIPIVKSSNMHVDDIPAQSFNNESKAFGAHNSPFISTPISTYVSGLEPPKDTPATFLIQPNNSNNIDLTKFSSDFTAIGGGANKYAVITPLEDRTSAFGNTISLPPADYSFQQITHNIPAITTRASARGGSVGLQNADYQSVRNIGPFTINTSAYDVSWGDYETDGTYSGVNALVNQKFLDKLNTKSLFQDGQFSNVPAGLGLRNVQVNKNFREVSDPDTPEYARQPFILRPMGSNWDSVLTETPGLGGTIGGVLEGALSVFGLLTKSSRNIADKARIFKYLISPNGLGFVAKQVGMQLLNPTLESKIYNPLSTLGIAGLSDLLQQDLTGNGSQAVSGLLQAASSFILPVSHVERHIPNPFFFNQNRYEDAYKVDKYESGPDKYSRLAFQAKAFSLDLGSPAPVSPMDENLNRIDDGLVVAIRRFQQHVFDEASIAAISAQFVRSNPNKYLFPVSSAPKSLENGKPSFIGTALDLGPSDVRKAISKPGGNFNKKTAKKTGGELIKRHSSLMYNQLKNKDRYERRLLSAGELNRLNDGTYKQYEIKQKDIRRDGKHINDGIGKQIRSFEPYYDGEFGIIKGHMTSDNVDKINMTPYGGGAEFERKMEDNPDFIKFRFKDKVNNKYIIFRAILEGISDSITPEYGEERYIGRPDKVYIYQGADRNISFGFSIYPKTKQELPVLMEKLNYLVGLCYPSYTSESERMKSPVMELTIGDMFTNASGILMGLTVSVEDATTWEIDEGLQFPHFIKAQCEFRYIGDNILATTGKHYNLGWVPDGNINRFGPDDLGYSDLDYPNRKQGSYRNIFAKLDQAKYDAELIPSLRERT